MNDEWKNSIQKVMQTYGNFLKQGKAYTQIVDKWKIRSDRSPDLFKHIKKKIFRLPFLNRDCCTREVFDAFAVPDNIAIRTVFFGGPDL